MPLVTAISVMLAVPDAPAASAWYQRALGATELWNLGSVIGLEIDGAPFFLAQPERNGWASPAELVRAVRVVAAGDALLAPAVTARVLGELYRRGHPSPVLATAIAALTARETDVLRLIAAGLSNAEIAAREQLSEHTVKTHVGNLFAKLAVRDRAQAVMVAYESGLVVPGV